MRRHRHVLCAAVAVVAIAAAAPVNISGTWTASVDMGSATGEPTLVLMQNGEKLTGTLTQPRGTRQITGTVKGDRVAFAWEASRDGGTVKASYSGTVESPMRMAGRVTFTGAITGSGTWVATKK